MSRIDDFFNVWENISNTTSVNKRYRKYGNLIIELSRSGRENVVRLNYLKSNNPNNKEASKFIDWLNTQSNKFRFNITTCAQLVGVYNKKRTLKKDQIVSWLMKHNYRIRYEYPDKEGVEMARINNNEPLPNNL